MSNKFLDSLSPIDPKRFMEVIKKTQQIEKSQPGAIWIVRNELKPVDLFCYLGARFGPPNGIQNFLRNDSSDNLIHWEWALESGSSILLFQGMNFRSEIHLINAKGIEKNGVNWLIDQIKCDLNNHGKEISNVRCHLEHWDQFLNPYHRIKSSIEVLRSELYSLKLDPSTDRIPDIDHETDMSEYKKAWEESNRRYPKGIGLCFGLRSMLPVRAEPFINLLIFILMKPYIKSDARLSESIYRQQIDIRVKSLSINCIGFDKPVDYEVLSDFHSLMMKRNDLLHGNVTLQDLIFDDTYFLGRVPVFSKYMSFWDRAHGAMLRGVGFENFENELVVVENMEKYLLSLLNEKFRSDVEQFMNTRELGIEKATKRLGVLFSDHIADFKMGTDERRNDP